MNCEVCEAWLPVSELLVGSKSISVGLISLIYREEIGVPILFPLPSKENLREKSWNVDLSWFSSSSPDHR